MLFRSLTGVILAARVRCIRVPSAYVRVDVQRVKNIDEALEVMAASDLRYRYSVAWIDCLASGNRLGRGILHRGNHADEPGPLTPPPFAGQLTVPVELPVSPLNRLTLSAFNALYYGKNRLSAGRHMLEPNPFFFPLDGVSRWNRIYGRDGFLQFQSAIPPEAALPSTRSMLTAIAASGQGSFLAVLKNFGQASSPGLLSFPRPGTTLALDFPNRGEPTRKLFRELYAMVRDAGGRIYPAKDAIMPASQFRTQYAGVLDDFRSQMDPAFSSSLWRRVMDG